MIISDMYNFGVGRYEMIVIKSYKSGKGRGIVVIKWVVRRFWEVPIMAVVSKLLI